MIYSIAHMIMEAGESHNLPCAKWKPKQLTWEAGSQWADGLGSSADLSSRGAAAPGGDWRLGSVSGREGKAISLAPPRCSWWDAATHTGGGSSALLQSPHVCLSAPRPGSLCLINARASLPVLQCLQGSLPRPLSLGQSPWTLHFSGIITKVIK